VTQIFSPTTSLQGGSLRASGARPSAGGDGGDGRGGSSRKPSWEASRPRWGPSFGRRVFGHVAV